MTPPHPVAKSFGPPNDRVAVLVVHDRRENLLALQVALEPLGERVLEAASEAEALRLLRHEDCAVVLIDVVTPGMFGTEMAEMIRADPRSRHVPIILLMDGSRPNESVFRGYAGAVEYLIKPVDPELVRSKVRVFTNLFRSKMQLQEQAERLHRAELEELARAGVSRYEFLADVLPLHVWQTDAAGHLVYISQQVRRYHGLDLSAIAGAPLSVVMNREDGRAWREGFRAALRSGEPLEMEARLKAFDGSERWHLMRMVARTDSLGRLDGWIGTSTDIDDRKRDELERARLLDAAVQAQARAEHRERQARLLQDAGSILIANEDVGTRLQRLVEWLVPDVADLAVIEGLRSDGRVDILGLAHRDPGVMQQILGLRHKASELWTDPSPALIDALGVGQDGPVHTVHVRLGTGSGPLGVFILGFGSRDQASLPDRYRLADELGRRISLLLENARLYDEQRRIARTLQFSLLSGAVPGVDGVTTAMRYTGATSGLEIGGDWYDAFPLDGGRLGLVVGDVVGRGMNAATVMGRLRSALRAEALEFEEPARVLTALDRFARAEDGAAYSTVLYAVFDPHRGVLRYASAGHPPPAVLDPDGQLVYLESGRSMPVAATSADIARTGDEVRVRPGSTLLLYTDGLIERRHEVIDQGLQRLAAAAVDARHEGLEDLADAVLERCLGSGGHEDDATLLAVRLTPATADVFARRLPALVRNLQPLRAELRAWLRQLHLDVSVINDVLVACGEACTNAIEHPYSGEATGDVALEAWLSGDELRVTVRDFGVWRRAALPGDRGRGLFIMEQLMDRVTITTRPVGTSVHLCKRVGPIARAHARERLPPADGDPADGDPLRRDVAP